MQIHFLSPHPLFYQPVQLYFQQPKEINGMWTVFKKKKLLIQIDRLK